MTLYSYAIYIYSFAYVDGFYIRVRRGAFNFNQTRSGLWPG